MSEDQAFIDWLLTDDGGNCVEYKRLGIGLYAAIKPLMFHWTMIVGQIGDLDGYEDRWCYANRAKAEAGLRAWDGAGDPVGWHPPSRHIQAPP